MPKPSAQANGPYSQSPPTLTPKQLVTFYSPEEWEEFIREWAEGLGSSYKQLKRMGGPGDMGVDVAAFKTDEQFEGAWDCFQGKHYAASLTPGDAYPEILKIFRHACAGEYQLPDNYVFLAPRGCGITLNRLLSSPSKLKKAFIERLVSGDALVADLDPQQLAAVRILAEKTEFSMFRSEELSDAVTVHAGTRYHSTRFGVALPERGPGEGPPKSVAAVESRYVEQLVEVYQEKYSDDVFQPDDPADHPMGKHFTEQRIRFYRAEALRVYARDSVPPGTFEALQDDVYNGVIDIAQLEHSTGYERLTQVLMSSTNLDLSNHALIAKADLNDRKGICHQLANDDRLDWMGTE